jgi:hypothetical protein
MLLGVRVLFFGGTMGKSLMEQIAMLSEEERNAVLSDMDMDSLIWDWKAWGRPEQQTPEGN